MEAHLNSTRFIRTILLLSSLIMGAIGFATYLAPKWVATEIIYIFAAILFSVGLIELLMLIGLFQQQRKGRSNLLLASSAVLHFSIAATLCYFRSVSVTAITLIFLTMITLESVLLLYFGARIKNAPARWWMLLGGLLSLCVAAVSIIHFGKPEWATWIAYLLAAKMLSIALLLAYVGLLTSDEDIALAFSHTMMHQQAPAIGSIYAVFYGPAFHCGIAVENQKVVDFLNDCKVRHVTWEEFLLGRKAIALDHPDVEPGVADEISQFATSLVGRSAPYDGLNFNCENFAILCRSVGKTHTSRFTQVLVGKEMLLQHPWLGSTLQALNRGLSWSLYGMGGPVGKKVAFFFVWLTNRVSDWLIVRPLRKNGETTATSSTKADEAVKQLLGK
jgi:uncharacterized membrane protein HdeD (DUF308 family)